ncbi:MAG: hypothetical protein IKO49_03020 [Bacilli bacterium]|nr:hypothetical protein [Bacilli bacterium]
MSMNKSKSALIAILVVGLVTMTVVYAALSTTLTISNSATVAATKWDVHFDNLQMASGNTATVATGKEAKISGPTSITGLEATFVKPGDSVSYTFDIVNGGDINAKLTSYTLGTPSCSGDTANFCKNNITYTLTYGTGNTAFAQNQVINAGQTINAKLTITLKNTVTAMPTTALTVSGLSATFVYSQQ